MDDSEVARLSRETDPRVIGQRIKNARVASSLTQEELGRPEASGAYISRIEAGNRRAGMKLLAHLAAKLGTSVEELVASETTDSRQAVDLRLDYAEIAVRSGDAQAALESVEEVLAEIDPRSALSLVSRARSIRASAFEISGDSQRAIAELERLVAEDTRDLRWIGTATALSRCYRSGGDHARAIEVGMDAAQEVERQGLSGTEEAIRLTLTVATALVEYGDVREAARLCQECLEEAEAIGSAVALASAYSNSSLTRSLRGDVPGAALLAKRAIDAFEGGTDARSLALLRGLLANVQLRLDPPDLDGAEQNIEQALAAGGWSDASTVAREGLRLTSAKVLMAKGRLAEAQDVAQTALTQTEGVSAAVAADASVVLGRIAVLTGRQSDAVTHFERAAQLLADCGTDRWVAQTWFELGSLLEQVGEDTAALDAYRSAAASTGLAMPNPSSVRV